MGVVAREHPKGSGRWVVFVSKGQFRFNQVIKEGEDRANDVAKKALVILETLGIRAAINMIRGHEAGKAGIPTVKEYAEKWKLTLEKRGKKLSTRTSYISNLDNRIIPAGR
jgi:hypothetical protein